MENLKEIVAFVAKNVKPGPILDLVEAQFGKTGRIIAVILALLIGALIGGYSTDAIWSWLN